MGENEHTVVAISRQMASGGSYIGYLLAKKLTFKYIDREILRQAAKELGTDTRSLEHFDEKSFGIISKILRECSFETTDPACSSYFQSAVYDKELFEVECRIMNRIMDECNAVIIGRGGFCALGKRPKMASVFIHAPLEFRVKRLMKLQNMSEQEARETINDSDQKRAKFIRDMIGVNWTDARNYNLCIDSSVIDFELSVELITRLVNGLQTS
jgi:CMP/dCMP kinase